MPENFNYIDPTAPFVVNGVSDPTSQRFHVSKVLLGYTQSILPFSLGHMYTVQCAYTHNPTNSLEVCLLFLLSYSFTNSRLYV